MPEKTMPEQSMPEQSMPGLTLDAMLAESPHRLVEHLGSVALSEIPLTLALYDAGDPTVDAPPEVVGWVLVLPGHAPLIVDADNPHQLVYASDLESVDERWSGRLGGALTAVVTAWPQYRHLRVTVRPAITGRTVNPSSVGRRAFSPNSR